MSYSFVTPWTIACQVPQSPGFTRQEYLSGLPFPSPGDFLDPRSNLHISCAGRQIFYPWVTREAPLEAQSLGKTNLKDINTAYVVQDNSPAPWAEMELFQQSAWGHRKSHQTSKSCASLFFFLLFSRSVVSDSVTPWTVAWVFSTPHHLLGLAQTHIYWVGDAIQPSHPLSFPSPPAFNLSQHQGLF